MRLINILYKGKKVACPLLGSSRFDGNGDRERIYDIFNSCITDVELTIFDYFQKSRAEEMKEVWSDEQKVRNVDKKAYYKMVSERKKAADERFKKNGHRRY